MEKKIKLTWNFIATEDTPTVLDSENYSRCYVQSSNKSQQGRLLKTGLIQRFRDLSEPMKTTLVKSLSHAKGTFKRKT